MARINSLTTLTVFYFAVSIGLGACNSKVMKAPAQQMDESFGELDSNEKASMMNYSFISKSILEAKCTSCHGAAGGVNLETYENVLANAEAVKQTVFASRTMPKVGALSGDEKKRLWIWLSMGLPRGNTDGSPTPEPDLQPTFESISRHILELKCVSCHSAAGTGHRIPLDKLSLLNSPLELVLPGNPDESGLVIAIERDDDKRMPPAKDGFSPLTDKEKASVRLWIQNGADN